MLPGAVCFHVARDPRDMAISTFLSYFHPVSDGWTASLASIRRVVEAERAVLPRALAVLQIPHESIVYEDLVSDPAVHASRCLSRLGLYMDDRVLAPEGNARAVFTL
ncbi:MAG: sulfotransferase, partial [bacterium]